MNTDKAPKCQCGCGKPTQKARNGRYNRYCLGHNPKRTSNSKRAKTRHKNGHFKPGVSGNPAGRPVGSKNAVSVASENILEGEGEALTRKLIELALEGNVACLRHAIDRLHPVKRSKPIKIKGMPVVSDIESAKEASAFLLKKVSAGEISPQDAETVSRLIDKFISATKWVDVEAQLDELRARLEGG